MILSYLSTTCNIPNPEYGDTERLDSNAVIRENRGQNPQTINDWPINTIKNYSIKCLTKSERDALEVFLILSAGRRITITDQESVVWSGIIITPIPEIICVGRSNDYDVQFDFATTVFYDGYLPV